MKRLIAALAVAAVLLVPATAQAKGRPHEPPYITCLRHAIQDLDMTRGEAMEFCRGVKV